MTEREEFLEAACKAWESLSNTAQVNMVEAYTRARELKKERDEAYDLLRECWEILNPDNEGRNAGRIYALRVKLGTRFKEER